MTLKTNTLMHYFGIRARGLAVCHDIALRHQGKMTLVNAEGACIILTLPLTNKR